MQIPREDDFIMSHTAKLEFGGRMPRRTVNASYYVRDIEGAQASTHKSIHPRSQVYLVYPPLEKARSAPARSRDELDSTSSKPAHPHAVPSELVTTWKANEEALNRPKRVHQRRHFRRTNYTDDIDGARAKTGPRTAEGVLSRRQLNPMDPHYKWYYTEEEQKPASEARKGGVHDGVTLAPAAPALVRSSGPRVRLETHLGPGMSLVTRRASDFLPAQVQRASAAPEARGRGTDHLSRSQSFADQMAVARSDFGGSAPPPPEQWRRLTPPARDPRMLDRSLITSDLGGAMAHRAHREAAGQEQRQRRTIRDSMVLVTAESDQDVRFSGLQVPSFRALGATSDQKVLSAQLKYEQSIPARIQVSTQNGSRGSAAVKAK